MLEIDQETIRSLLEYDPSTGIFTWRAARRARAAGSVAGWRHRDGHIKITVLAKKYFAHRLAWVYQYGSNPAGEIDHINGDPADNRITNLRDVSHKENLRNKRRQKNGSSPACGVAPCPSGKWQSTIKVDGRTKYLGRFASFDEAVTARKEAESLYGFHQNHGRAA